MKKTTGTVVGLFASGPLLLAVPILGAAAASASASCSTGGTQAVAAIAMKHSRSKSRESTQFARLASSPERRRPAAALVEIEQSHRRLADSRLTRPGHTSAAPLQK
ncbi:hypothetical protein ACFWN1_00920 [Streptomyces sp. NPDC058459]|uniref:hypothetical protein n=1 Tax=Streptomyces sp. NPDC058459 TaxID=3346508 RepID=UPI003648CD2A